MQLDECDLCHDIIPYGLLEWQENGQLLCDKCKNNKMQFVIIYKNDPDIRSQVENIVLNIASKGHDFSQQAIQHPMFQTSTRWLTGGELSNLPFTVQVEEVKIKDNKLISIKKLIIDVEEITNDQPKEITVEKK